MWSRHLKVRRVADEDAYFDAEDDGAHQQRPAGPPADEDEEDPLDAFMNENNLETLSDLRKTFEKADMLKVHALHAETAAANHAAKRTRRPRGVHRR